MSAAGLVTLLFSAVQPLTRQGAQDAARHELAKRPYQQALPPVWVRPLRWLLGKIAEVWFKAASATGGSAALAALIMLALAVIALVIWRVGPMSRSSRRDELSLHLAGASTATDHRAAADAFAAREQWAEAVRERLRAISRELEERALVDRRPGRTTYELAAEGGLALPASAAMLREAAERFATIWYGSRRATAEDYRRLTKIDAAVRRDHPARTAAPADDMGAMVAP
jgi:Domain of unknown function (DUF4129)